MQDTNTLTHSLKVETNKDIHYTILMISLKMDHSENVWKAKKNCN